MQLTSFGGAAVGGPAWSPDGQKIAFHAYPGGEGFVYIVSASGGVPSRLITDPPGGRWPNWSRDGRSIYFGTDSGGSSQIYVAAVTGGKAVQITQDLDDPDRPHESTDGRFVYYMKGYLVPQSVWRVPVEGGAGSKVLDVLRSKAFFSIGRDGVYFFGEPDEERSANLLVYEFATGKTRKIVTIKEALGGTPFGPNDISPDGRTLLYTQLDESGSDLMLVENFR